MTMNTQRVSWLVGAMIMAIDKKEMDNYRNGEGERCTAFPKLPIGAREFLEDAAKILPDICTRCDRKDAKCNGMTPTDIIQKFFDILILAGLATLIDDGEKEDPLFGESCLAMFQVIDIKRKEMRREEE